MKDALYEYRDGAGRLHTFTDINVAYKSYKAFASWFVEMWC